MLQIFPLQNTANIFFVICFAIRFFKGPSVKFLMHKTIQVVKLDITKSINDYDSQTFAQ